MTTFVTQCPHCRTRFRLSRTQLTAARGAVRCGACLEIFNAARDLENDDVSLVKDVGVQSAMPGAASPRPPSPTTATPTDEARWLHDDLDLDELDLDAELAKLEREEHELARELLQLDAQRTKDDEAWAERLLSAEDDRPPSTAVGADSTSAAETEQSLQLTHLTPVTTANPAPPSPLKGTHRVLSEPVTTQPPPRAEPALGAGPPDEDDETSDAVRITATGETLDSQPSSRNREEPLFELDEEPLQLDWEARRRPWGRWLGWGLLNLIALLVLAAQYVTYSFDELSRQDEYRPWLEKVCSSLGCELPAKVDIAQIKSSNLVVRSHPEFTGALIVDAIIYNRAPFAQPFPLLEVRFADINGQTLASRSFKPGEYLSGELAGQREMPSQVPIHIALDILDPGTKAVNYSLSFRSPD